MPEISVIVPVFKVEQYLHECVDSILAQSFTDFELILIDDGSPDNCGKICDEYCEKDNRIIVVHQENGGLSVARNAGLDIAKGKYVTFIDSDDIVSKQYLELLYKAIIDNNCEVSICNDTMFFDGEEVNYIKNDNASIYSGRDAVFGIYDSYKVPVTAWGKIYLRDLFNGIRFPRGRIHEDNFVVPIILYLSKKVCLLECSLYWYRQRKDSIMGQPFSIKRYDVLFATDHCIQYFEDKNEDEIVKLAVIQRNLLLFLYSHQAKKNHIYKDVPKEYKIPEINLLLYLKHNLPDYKYTYQLAKVHPNWIKPHEYLRKLKKILGLKVKD